MPEAQVRLPAIGHPERQEARMPERRAPRDCHVELLQAFGIPPDERQDVAEVGPEADLHEDVAGPLGSADRLPEGVERGLGVAVHVRDCANRGMGGREGLVAVGALGDLDRELRIRTRLVDDLALPHADRPPRGDLGEVRGVARRHVRPRIRRERADDIAAFVLDEPDPPGQRRRQNVGTPARPFEGRHRAFPLAPPEQRITEHDLDRRGSAALGQRAGGLDDEVKVALLDQIEPALGEAACDRLGLSGHEPFTECLGATSLVVHHLAARAWRSRSAVGSSGRWRSA